MNTVTLEILVTLSRIDSALSEIDRQVEAAPARLQRLRDQIREHQAELAGTEQDMSASTARRRECELEAETLKSKLAEYEQQLFSIKSNDDYQAMVRQIQETNARMLERENEALELMEREETLTERLDAARARISDRIGGCEEEIQSIETQVTELTRQREAKVEEHQRALDHLDADTRRLYDRIRSGKGALPVTAVEKGACGGCHSALPPQHINEARLGTKLITCEACGRIVVWDETTSAYS